MRFTSYHQHSHDRNSRNYQDKSKYRPMSAWRSPNNVGAQELYSTLQADVLCIGRILLLLFLFLMVWGATMESCRALQLTLRPSGFIGLSLGVATCLAFIQKDSWRIATKSQELWGLLALLILAAFYAWFRGNFATLGADACQYYSRAAYVSAYPTTGLSFGLPGWFTTDKPIIYGIWIPYTFEYLTAFLSLLTGVQLLTVIATGVPMFWAFLTPFPSYLLFRKVGASPFLSVALTLLTLALLIFDSATISSIGDITFFKTVENKGILLAVGLPTFWFFALDALWPDADGLTPEVGPMRYTRLFIVSSALCFMSFNAVYLLPASIFFLGTPILFSNIVRPGLSRVSYSTVTGTVIAVVTVPILMFCSTQYFNQGTVESVRPVWAILNRLDDNFSDVFFRLFGENGITTYSYFTLLASTLLFSNSQTKQKIHIFIAAWFLFLSFVVINPWLYEFIKSKTMLYMSYRRFFFAFPLFLLPGFAITCVLNRRTPKSTPNWPNGKYATLSTVAIILLASTISMYQKAEPLVRALQEKHSLTGVESLKYGMRNLDFYSKRGLFQKDDVLLIDRSHSSMALLALTGIRQLVIHGYYLLASSDDQDNYADNITIIKAQHFLTYRNSPYQDAFRTTLEKHHPKALIFDKFVLGQTAPILESLGYGRVRLKDHLVLYVSNTKNRTRPLPDMKKTQQFETTTRTTTEAHE